MTASSTNLSQLILEECQVMIRFALASGKPVPPDAVEIVDSYSESDNIQLLVHAHKRLSTAVSPATPRSLRYLQNTVGKDIVGILRSIPFIRNLLIIAVFCLIVFIVTSLTNEVRAETINKSYLELFGRELLLIELFFLSAAGLGASFAALFQANRYIVRGTFDPGYIPSYAIRFALGLIAGILLAEIVPLEIGEDGVATFTKPTLAMLGGFSASAVYKILQRLLLALEALIHGDNAEVLIAEQELHRLEIEQQLDVARLQLAIRLMTLQKQITPSTSNEVIRQQLDDLFLELMPEAVQDVALPNEVEH